MIIEVIQIITPLATLLAINTRDEDLLIPTGCKIEDAFFGALPERLGNYYIYYDSLELRNIINVSAQSNGIHYRVVKVLYRDFHDSGWQKANGISSTRKDGAA